MYLTNKDLVSTNDLTKKGYSRQEENGCLGQVLRKDSRD